MTDAPTPMDAMRIALLESSLQGDYGSLPTQEDADDILAALSSAGYVVAPMELLAELAGDVEAYVTQEFDRTEGYPSMQAKKARAMDPVLRARAMIAEGEKK